MSKVVHSVLGYTGIMLLAMTACLWCLATPPGQEGDYVSGDGGLVGMLSNSQAQVAALKLKIAELEQAAQHAQSGSEPEWDFVRNNALQYLRGKVIKDLDHGGDGILRITTTDGLEFRYTPSVARFKVEVLPGGRTYRDGKLLSISGRDP